MQEQTIQDLNAQIRAIVEAEIRSESVKVGGVISRCSTSERGHTYFTLNDGDYSIRCMLWKNDKGKIGVTPRNRMDVEVTGKVNVYEPNASIELKVESIELVDASQEYKDTKAILKDKGLWPKEKRPLPPNVKHIGLVTGKGTDALADFETNYRKEGGIAQITVVDVSVQGEYAPPEIADAITKLNRENEVDVIVITRGGGRIQDFVTVFDSLMVPEAIARSEIVTVTGLGHERYHTVADDVADVNVSTPTAAAVALAKVSQAPTQPQTPDTPQQPSPLVPVLIGMVAVMGIAIIILLIVAMS